VHIPKCGGTSFSNLLLKRNWKEHLAIRGIRIKDLKYLKCSPQHYHSEILNQLFNLKEFDKKIAIVRDPFNRLKSEYYWQIKANIIDQTLAPYEWFNKIIDCYSSDNYIYDNHIRPQSEFLIKDLKIFKLEANGLISALNYSLGLDVKTKSNFISKFRFPHIKRTKKNKYIDNQFLEFKSKIVDFYLKDYEMFSYSLKL